MIRIDTNGDGLIDYNEFMNKFGPARNKEAENLIMDRAKSKLHEINYLMSNHMQNFKNAFEMFDTSKNGTLAFSEFNSLIQKLYQAAGKDAPTYSVVKDLYDAIDVKKDGNIDRHEWNAAFIH